MTDWEKAMLDLQLQQTILLKNILGVVLRKQSDEVWGSVIDFTDSTIRKCQQTLNGNS